MDYLQKNIFTLSYPLPKMDQVAVPLFRSDSGAMENWGMMTFRLERILDSPDNNKGKYYLDWLISHELVHQWIGNVVTMAWWNDTWLNEGVTSYLQYHGHHSIACWERQCERKPGASTVRCGHRELVGVDV